MILSTVVLLLLYYSVLLLLAVPGIELHIHSFSILSGLSGLLWATQPPPGREEPLLVVVVSYINTTDHRLFPEILLPHTTVVVVVLPSFWWQCVAPRHARHGMAYMTPTNISTCCAAAVLCIKHEYIQSEWREWNTRYIYIYIYSSNNYITTNS